MSFASLNDVKQVLRLAVSNTDFDAELTTILGATEEVVADMTNGNWDVSGSVQEDFYNLRQDERIILRNTNPVTITIEGFSDAAAASTPTTLVEDEAWQHVGSGEIVFIFGGLASPIGLPNARVALQPGRWERVEVTYTADGIVPKAITKATAMIAAATFAREEREIQGLFSERLGDYSYVVATNPQTGTGLYIPRTAELMLAAWARAPKAVAL